jgi:hypothetical protein
MPLPKEEILVPRLSYSSEYASGDEYIGNNRLVEFIIVTELIDSTQ